MSTLGQILDEFDNTIDSSEHICVCGVSAYAHRQECYMGEEPHSHCPALCCDNCPCLSVEQAHPSAVGTPLESLPSILHSRTLSTRTLALLAEHAVYTAERLETLWLQEVIRWNGFGKVRLHEVILTQRLWRLAVRRGDVVPEPLPETR